MSSGLLIGLCIAAIVISIVLGFKFKRNVGVLGIVFA